ncbi:MAG: redoxin domain-containing protein [Chloroflexi bacterium]|nr:redoxin domain-containing protein [Chloroflexota bacterium]
MGGIYVTRLVSQIAEPGTRPPPSPLTPSKTYTLSTNVIPEAGGEIKIVSPSSSSGTFEPGSQITLMAIPDDCYTFDGGHWEIDGTLYWKETFTITMDSDKTVAAHFRLKDTTPPAISEVKTTSYSDISATITWETDDEVTSQVEYGETEAYGKTAQSKSEPDTSDGFKYSARLTGLEPNTTYYFKVKVEDKCGNPKTSSTKKLTTLSKIPDGYEVGKRPPPFTLPSYQDNNPESPNKGQKVSLSDFKGKKILLNFWNTFCGACIGEFPLIRGIYNGDDCKQNKGDLAVITICIDSRIDEAADRIKILEDKYSDEAGPFTFPILLDTEENSAKASYHIWTIPKTVFIDSDGIIREIKIGRFNSKEEIEAILKSLD